MTEEEIKKLAAEIVRNNGGFYVEPEEHYQQHQRLDKFLDLYDSASNIFIKAFLGAAVLGIIALAAIGSGITK